MPSPEYPSRQVQVKVPGVFLQFACEWQFPLLLAHSLTSITTQQNISPQYKLTKINTCTKRLKNIGGFVQLTCPVDRHLSPSWLSPNWFVAYLTGKPIFSLVKNWIYIRYDTFVANIMDINRRYISCQHCCAVTLPTDVNSWQKYF